MSFVELEGIFRKAERENDTEYLKLLDHELGFRNKNSKTPGLKAKVARAITKIPARQEDFFETANPLRVTKSSGGKMGTAHSKPRARTKSTFKPADEQRVALDAFIAGSSLKINAFAGTGKTSTLQLLSNATGAKGQSISGGIPSVGRSAVQRDGDS